MKTEKAFAVFVFAGLLFKVLHWNLYSLPNNQEHLVNYFRHLKLRLGFWSELAILLYLIPMATQFKIQHWNDSEMARLQLRSIFHRGNEDYKQAMDEDRDKKQNQQTVLQLLAIKG